MENSQIQQYQQTKDFIFKKFETLRLDIEQFLDAEENKIQEFFFSLINIQKQYDLEKVKKQNVSQYLENLKKKNFSLQQLAYLINTFCNDQQKQQKKENEEENTIYNEINSLIAQNLDDIDIKFIKNFKFELEDQFSKINDQIKVVFNQEIESKQQNFKDLETNLLLKQQMIEQKQKQIEEEQEHFINLSQKLKEKANLIENQKRQHNQCRRSLFKLSNNNNQQNIQEQKIKQLSTQIKQLGQQQVFLETNKKKHDKELNELNLRLRSIKENTQLQNNFNSVSERSEKQNTNAINANLYNKFFCDIEIVEEDNNNKNNDQNIINKINNQEQNNTQNNPQNNSQHIQQINKSRNSNRSITGNYQLKEIKELQQKGINRNQRQLSVSNTPKFENNNNCSENGYEMHNNFNLHDFYKSNQNQAIQKQLPINQQMTDRNIFSNTIQLKSQQSPLTPQSQVQRYQPQQQQQYLNTASSIYGNNLLSPALKKGYLRHTENLNNFVQEQMDILVQLNDKIKITRLNLVQNESEYLQASKQKEILLKEVQDLQNKIKIQIVKTFNEDACLKLEAELDRVLENSQKIEMQEDYLSYYQKQLQEKNININNLKNELIILKKETKMIRNTLKNQKSVK